MAHIWRVLVAVANHFVLVVDASGGQRGRLSMLNRQSGRDVDKMPRMYTHLSR